MNFENKSDKEIIDLLIGELERRTPVQIHTNLDLLVQHIRLFPAGLRAMAATYQFDVSMALDDLGWHFANQHHKDYYEETLVGLRELGASEEAVIFSSAYQMVLPYWDEIGRMVQSDFHEFADWYNDSELDKTLGPLNTRLWEMSEELGEFGFMQHWINYAKMYPERLV